MGRIQSRKKKNTIQLFCAESLFGKVEMPVMDRVKTPPKDTY